MLNSQHFQASDDDDLADTAQKSISGALRQHHHHDHDQANNFPPIILMSSGRVSSAMGSVDGVESELELASVHYCPSGKVEGGGERVEVG